MSTFQSRFVSSTLLSNMTLLTFILSAYTLVVVLNPVVDDRTLMFNMKSRSYHSRQLLEVLTFLPHTD